MAPEPLIRVRDLCIDYRMGKRKSVSVVRDISLDIHRGESVALVGESGSGKTTLALAMLRLLPKLGMIRSGSIQFQRRDGEMVDLLGLGEEQLRRFRWTEAAMVYQGAQNFLNPLSKVKAQFMETAAAHGTGMSSRDIELRATELLELVRLDPPRVLGSYPHELSGGMKQRVLIALGLLLHPQLVVLDEPTTALDILTQRAVIDVLRQLQEQLNFAMLFVSHDLSLAAELADRVVTMYAGRVIELGGVREVFYNPRHPYTIGLINAVVPAVGDLPDATSIPGSPPAFGSLPSGCPFHPRCPYSEDVCHTQDPALLEVEAGHAAACHFAAEMPLKRKTDNDG